MNKNLDSWVRGMFAAPRRQAMPVMTYPGLTLAGLNVMDIVTDGDKQYACMRALAERFPLVAAMTLMDLSVEAEAFGCPIRFSEEDVPTVTGAILGDIDQARALEVPSVAAGRMPAYVEAARRTAAHFTDRPTFGGMIGPFSLAVRLRDMTQVMMDLIMEPELIHVILEKCTALTLAYARAFKAAGAGGVLIAEPAAGLVSPEHCDEFSSAYLRRIVAGVQDENFAVILHNCGNAAGLVGSMASTGARGLHFGNAVEMTQILPQVPPDVLAFGNIDPARTFRAGTPEGMREAVAKLLAATAEYPNFVLSSGCDIPPGTPIEVIDAFFAAWAEA